MNKRLTRVLSLIMVLAMFLSVGTPALALDDGWDREITVIGDNGGFAGDDANTADDGEPGEGWDREIGEGEIRAFDAEPDNNDPDPKMELYTANEELGYEVTVEAPMGALPTLAELRAEPVEIENIREAVGEVVEGEPNILVALDISFWLGEDEIEPEEPVQVIITAPELEGKKNLTLVHLPEEDEPETIELIDDGDLAFTLGTNEIAFESKNFSVYAVVEGGPQSDVMLTVEFYDGTERINAQVIRKDQIESLDSPVYDPGVPAIGADQSFEGWALLDADEDVQTFKYDEETESYDVDALNAYVKEIYADMEEDATIRLVAMTYYVRYVVYHDQAGAVLKTQFFHVPSQEGGTANVTISMPYVGFMQGQNFAGWVVKAVVEVAGDYPLYADDVGTVYQNDTSYVLSDSMDIYPYLNTGNWLVFDNYIDQDSDTTTATYVAPVFYAEGENTAAPDTPERNGYTFVGWFKDKDFSSRFVFGSPINEETTVYAKWTPKETTYRVVFWQQKASDAVNLADADKTYDFYSSVERSATTGTSVSINTATSGTTADNRLGGNSTSSIGEMGYYFTYNGTRTDTDSVVVKGDGSTVLNVYYDRRTITITFKSSSNSNASTLYTRTGLYEGPLTNWPSAGSGYRWYWVYNSSGSSYSLSIDWNSYTIYGTTKDSTQTEWTLYRSSWSAGNSPKTIYWYGQDTDGNYNYLMTTGLLASGSEVYFDSTLFLGFKLYGYNTSSNSTSGSNFHAVSSSGSMSYSNISGSYGYVFYNRNQWNFAYESNSENVKNVSVYYQKSLADLASYEPTNGPDGYYFDGWYADPGFTTPFDFSSTMPNANVTVYAKWTMMRFRVVLDPTGGDESISPSEIVFPGDQATTFRVDYGEKIQASSLSNGTRDGYTLIGWYLDEDYTIPYNFSNPITDSIADMTYATASDGERQGTDPWNSKNPTYTDVGRANVVGKVTIYARWRQDPDGVIGINVRYDAVEGTGHFESGEPYIHEDTEIYADRAQAYAQTASMPDSDLLQFLYWDILNADGTSSGRKAYPGQTWEVRFEDTVEEPINNNTENVEPELFTIDNGNLNIVRPGQVGLMATGSELDAALNVAGGSLTFVSDGLYAWSATGDYATSGNHNQSSTTSSVSTTINMVEGDQLSFRWKVSSEARYDVLYFYDNNNTITSISGNKDWAVYTYTATSSGSHTFAWSYTKDSILDSNDDAGYLDDVAYLPITTYYTVTFKDGYDNSTISTQQVEEGAAATAPDAPDHTGDGYIFTGWDTDYSYIMADTVVTAQYVNQSEQEYTVTFRYMDSDGNWTSSSQTVQHGQSATAPTIPTPPVGYEFNSWDKKFDTITSNLTINAVYKQTATTKYVVTLRAVYGRSAVDAKTHITWYGNNDPEEVTSGDRQDVNLGINVACDIPTPENFTPGTRDGETGLTFADHVFLGWARLETTADDLDGTAHPELTEADLYLKWDAQNKKYQVEVDGTWKDVTQVAADEEQPYHDMYAVWAKVFYVYHSSDNTVERYVVNNVAKFDIASLTRDNSLYGGYYSTYGGVSEAYMNTDLDLAFDARKMEWDTPADASMLNVAASSANTLTDAAGAKKYDGGNVEWVSTDSISDNGLAMSPTAGTTYFIKEVPADKYLQPYFHYTYHKDNGAISSAWLISDIDDSMYKETGFVISTEDKTAYVCSTLTVQNKVGGASVLLKPETIFRAKGVTKGYLSYLDVISGAQTVNGMGTGVTIKQYWVTPDGLIVTSTNARTYANLENKSNVKDGVSETAVASTIAVFTTSAGNTTEP